MEFAQKAMTLEENAIITKDYSEEIIVPKGKTLVIEGFTNRLITNLEGTIIVKGTCNRIKNIGGKVIVNTNGYVHNLFGMYSSAICEISGFVHKLILRDHAKSILNSNSMVKYIYNQDSEIIMQDNSYANYYTQYGNVAKISIGKSSVISNYEIKKGLFY